VLILPNAGRLIMRGDVNHGSRQDRVHAEPQAPPSASMQTARGFEVTSFAQGVMTQNRHRKQGCHHYWRIYCIDQDQLMTQSSCHFWFYIVHAAYHFVYEYEYSSEHNYQWALA
jgi:hypothetical protein